MEFDWGFYINHEAFINSMYNNVIMESGIKQSYCVLENMFNICGQFIMDSQYDKLKFQQEKNIITNKKNLKRQFSHIKNIDTNSQIDTNICCEILNQIKSIFNIVSCETPNDKNSNSLEEGKFKHIVNSNINKRCDDLNTNLLYKQIVSQGLSLIDEAINSDFKININNKYINDKLYDHENNKAARQILNLPNPGQIFVKECKIKNSILQNSSIITLNNKVDILEIENIIDQYIKINSEQPFFATIVKNKNTEIQFEIGKYILQSNCAFLNSDISSIHILTDVGIKYDCIVIDPPWSSKSVKRKKMYRILEASDLLKIPLSELCNEGALILVWVTNKKVHKQFVLDELFKKHNITFLTQWIWLKVTKYMEPVVSFHNSNNKKPYEILLIGRFCQQLNDPNSSNFNGQQNMLELSSVKVQHDIEKNQYIKDINLKKQTKIKEVNAETSNNVFENIFIDKIMVSVPCIIHSHKPPLDDIIKKYSLNKNMKKLELFARSLKPDWTSWGNEVLFFQHEQYFQKIL